MRELWQYIFQELILFDFQKQSEPIGLLQKVGLPDTVFARKRILWSVCNEILALGIIQHKEALEFRVADDGCKPPKL